jgi:hypothetical protein
VRGISPALDLLTLNRLRPCFGGIVRRLDRGSDWIVASARLVVLSTGSTLASVSSVLIELSICFFGLLK